MIKKRIFLSYVLIGLFLLQFVSITSVLAGLGGGSSTYPYGYATSVTVTDTNGGLILQGESIRIRLDIENIGTAAGGINVYVYISGPSMSNVYVGVVSTGTLQVNAHIIKDLTVPYTFTSGSTYHLNAGSYSVSSLRFIDNDIHYQYPNSGFTIYPLTKTISGYVYNQNSQIISGATVNIWNNYDSVNNLYFNKAGSTTTTGTGYFTITVSADTAVGGYFHVQALKYGFVSNVVNVLDEGSPDNSVTLNIDLTNLVSIIGTITEPVSFYCDSQTFTPATVTLTETSNSAIIGSPITSTDGTFAFYLHKSSVTRILTVSTDDYYITSTTEVNTGSDSTPEITLKCNSGITNTEDFESFTIPSSASNGRESSNGWSLPSTLLNSGDNINNYWSISTNQKYSGTSSLRASGGDFSQFQSFGWRTSFSDGKISGYFYPQTDTYLASYLGLRTSGCTDIISTNCYGYFLRIYRSYVNLYRRDGGSTWESLGALDMGSNIGNSWYYLKIEAENNMITAWVKNMNTNAIYPLTYNIQNDPYIYSIGTAVFGSRLGSSQYPTYIDDIAVTQYDVAPLTYSVAPTSSTYNTLTYKDSLNFDFFANPDFNGHSPGCDADGNCPAHTSDGWQISSNKYAWYETGTFMPTQNNPSSGESLHVEADTGEVTITQGIGSDTFSTFADTAVLFKIFFKSSFNDIANLEIYGDSIDPIDSGWTAALPDSGVTNGWTELSVIVNPTQGITNLFIQIQIKNSDPTITTNAVDVFIDSASGTYISVQNFQVDTGAYSAGIISKIIQYYPNPDNVAGGIIVGVSIAYRGLNNYKLSDIKIAVEYDSNSVLSGIYGTELNNDNFMYFTSGGQASSTSINSNSAILKLYTELAVDEAAGAIGEAIDPAGGFVIGFVIGKVASALIDQFFEQHDSPTTTTMDWNYGSYYGSYEPTNCGCNDGPSNYLYSTVNEMFFVWHPSAGASISIKPQISIGIPKEMTQSSVTGDYYLYNTSDLDSSTMITLYPYTTLDYSAS